MSLSLRRASSPAPSAPPVALHAPLFQSVVEGLDETQRRVALDLGAASTELLAWLGRSRCRADIADLAFFGGIERLNAAEPGPEVAEVAESMLPTLRREDPLDLVFCWDLPNYLSLDALAALMRAIERRARPGAFVHALIFYAGRDMPEHPGRFVPTEGGELMNLGVPGAPIAAPRYSPEELGVSMRPFAIDRVRLLSNGMQEFLFQLEP